MGIIKSFFQKPDIGTKNESYRSKWLERILATLPPGSKILDAGAGELKYRRYCSHLDYVSQDFCQYKGEGKEGLHTNSWDNSKIDIISDICDIPTENHAFDAVMCVEVLEHIADPIKAIRELSRILKPNGKLILTAPFCSLTHFAPYYFANGFSKYWHEKILGENGFEIKEIDFNGDYFSYLAQEIRRLPNIEKKYTGCNTAGKLFNKVLRYLILKNLQRISEKDRSSRELLCYGLHVLAVKK